MEFSIKNGNPEKLRADCLIVGVYEGKKLSDSAKILDDVTEKAISKILKTGDMEGKLATTLVLHHLPNVSADRVMLVGLGKSAEFSDRQYRQCVKAAVKALPKGVASAGFFLTELPIKKSDIQSKVTYFVEVVMDATYRVNAVKEKKPEAATFEKAIIVVAKAENLVAEKAMNRGLAIAQGVNLAKDLGNLPPNICTPTYMGEQAKKLAKEYGFKVEVLDKSQIEKLGMGSFLGVAQGSEEPPRLIVLQHLKGKKNQKPVVLV
ncbi:MAG TPA: leucyl aminopeptidase, partial [Methylophilaceae bacterium]|nr:leucyl aminopeptidase [Methylophilaceae bacterium]